MITSSANQGWTSDILIADPAAAGLSHPSVIRPVKVACIARERVIRVAGKLDPETAGRLRTAIADILAN
jgi:mRNA interferase MazF